MKIRKILLPVTIALALVLGGLNLSLVEADSSATITGVPKVGQTLTLNTTLEYDDIHWYRYNATDGEVFVGHLSNMYEVTAAELGYYIVAYVILPSGSDPAFVQSNVFGPITTTLEGNPVVGETITVEADSSDFEYHFYRAPTGTTAWEPAQITSNNTYVLQSSDEGYDFIVNVIRSVGGALLLQTNRLGPVLPVASSEDSSSEATSSEESSSETSTPELPANRFEGTLVAGNTLTIVTGLQYDRIDWFRKVGEEYVLIEGASGTSYVLQSDDVGYVIYANIWVGEGAYQIFTSEPVAAESGSEDSSLEESSSVDTGPDDDSTTPGDRNIIWIFISLFVVSLLSIVAYNKRSKASNLN